MGPFGDFTARVVSRLKPGEQINVSLRDLCEAAPPYEYNGATFLPEDQVLENVVGSCYEWGYRPNDRARAVTFYRNGPDQWLGPTYVSPDRRYQDGETVRNGKGIG